MFGGCGLGSFCFVILFCCWVCVDFCGFGCCLLVDCCFGCSLGVTWVVLVFDLVVLECVVYILWVWIVWLDC